MIPHVNPLHKEVKPLLKQQARLMNALRLRQVFPVKAYPVAMGDSFDVGL